MIFEDGTDIYWARSRMLEYLSKITASLPPGVKTELGPDATSVGWVYQYALVDRSGKHSSDELRSMQDWFLRYGIQSAPGVAEVATVGGQARQFQVQRRPQQDGGLPDPHRSRHRRRQGRQFSEVGGRLVEYSGREYMVRGRGYVKTTKDLEQAVLKAENGTPVRLGDVATVTLGPEMRRGLADLDGQGDAVGGIVVMRQGENALNVIERVKTKISELKQGAARRRGGGHGLRPLGADRQRHQDREAQAHRGDDRRLDHHPRLPVAHPLGHRAHHHHPRQRGPGLHPDAAASARTPTS